MWTYFCKDTLGFRISFTLHQNQENSKTYIVARLRIIYKFQGVYNLLHCMALYFYIFNIAVVTLYITDNNYFKRQYRAFSFCCRIGKRYHPKWISNVLLELFTLLSTIIKGLLRLHYLSIFSVFIRIRCFKDAGKFLVLNKLILTQIKWQECI